MSDVAIKRCSSNWDHGRRCWQLEAVRSPADWTDAPTYKIVATGASRTSNAETYQLVQSNRHHRFEVTHPVCGANIGARSNCSPQAWCQDRRCAALSSLGVARSEHIAATICRLCKLLRPDAGGIGTAVARRSMARAGIIQRYGQAPCTSLAIGSANAETHQRALCVIPAAVS